MCVDPFGSGAERRRNFDTNSRKFYASIGALNQGSLGKVRKSFSNFGESEGALSNQILGVGKTNFSTRPSRRLRLHVLP